MCVQKCAILMNDAKCLIAHWQYKGHIATTLYEKLVTQFHEKAPAYLSVTNRLRRIHFGEDILEPGIHPGKLLDALIDFKILTELTVFPFHNVRTFATTLKIPPSTRWDHL
jgi:hypothetical protein